MKPNPNFVKLPKAFWAVVKTVSQHCRYTVGAEKTIEVPSAAQIEQAFQEFGLDLASLKADVKGKPLIALLEECFQFGAAAGSFPTRKNMKSNPTFVKLPKSFWAAVKTVSQHCGYTIRGESMVKVPSAAEIERAFQELGLNADSLAADVKGKPLITLLGEYFQFRADTLNREIEPLLMNAEEAKHEFEELRNKLTPTCPLPMNKQKGEMKAPAYLTGMVNMLIEANSNGHPVDYDPRELTTVTQNGAPLRTLSRRVDGAFPRQSIQSQFGKLKNITTRLHLAAVSQTEFMKRCSMEWRSRNLTSQKISRFSITSFWMLVTHGGRVAKATFAESWIWCKWAMSMK